MQRWGRSLKQGLGQGALWPVVLALLLGLVAGALCSRLGTPLPWMIGPLFATAALRLCGVNLHCPVPLREAGQWAIGTVLGLYFTAPVLAVLASYGGFIAAAVSFALVLGWVCSQLLHRLCGIDRTTAFFAMAVGGASEMATQGERHGAVVEYVAAAHSVRIMLVVALIPFALRHWGAHWSTAATPGFDLHLPGVAAVDAGALLVLMLLTSGAALFCKRIGMPNSWVIGPLLMALLLTASGVHLSHLPEPIILLGQLFIGISLGTRFTPGFVRSAPRFLGSVVLCTLLALVLAACFGLILSRWAGMHPGTAILATSPGGIAEMSLTARTLHLGVPIVAAFHVVRMVVLVLAIGPVYRLGLRLGRPR
jgi:membrane AbrB-like protein